MFPFSPTTCFNVRILFLVGVYVEGRLCVAAESAAGQRWLFPQQSQSRVAVAASGRGRLGVRVRDVRTTDQGDSADGTPAGRCCADHGAVR